MKKFKKFTLLALSLCLCALLFSGCGGNQQTSGNSSDSSSGTSAKENNRVVIYTSAEDFRVEYIRGRLNEKFPDYDIVIEYMTTGNQAAKLIAEGKDTECDIAHDLEYGYLHQLEDANILADLSAYDFSIYVDDAVESSHFLPEVRNGGAIVIDEKALNDKNIPIPESYEDLLKEDYRGLICMPNPKSSGTGYMFLRTLVNTMGEAAAFEYFDKLSENITEFTSSGSGPINNLIQGECAIGFGMTSQAVKANNDGATLSIKFFGNGSPYSMYGQAMISGKETRACVKEVFDFLGGDVSKENVQKYYPEAIFKGLDCEVENYPTNIKYSDMSNNTPEEKARLLDMWKY